MTPRIVVVIQARVGSTRLPGKVLAEVADRPMLRFQLDRLSPLRCDDVVVATTTRREDDPVAELASDAGAAVVRGSERDVLSRFGQVLDELHPDHVVRLTGDCPLTDPAIVQAVVDLHLGSGASYTSNVHPRSFPKGLDVEVAEAGALAAARQEAVLPYEREHVTPFLYNHPERFPSANLDSGQDLGSLSWTVDTPTDLEHVRRLVACVEDPIAATWGEVLVAAQQAGIS